MSACHRLLIGDNRKRLQCRLRESSALPIGDERGNHRLKYGTTDKLPSAGGMAQLISACGDASLLIAFIFIMQFKQCLLNKIHVHSQYSCQIFGMLRIGSHHENRFQTGTQASREILDIEIDIFGFRHTIHSMLSVRIAVVSDIGPVIALGVRHEKSPSLMIVSVSLSSSALSACTQRRNNVSNGPACLNCSEPCLKNSSTDKNLATTSISDLASATN